MKFWEVLKVAFASLRGNKLRSSLTVLGIVIGIFSIISISTVITMLQNSISAGLSQLGKNTFQIQKFPAMQQGRLSDKIRNRKNLTIEEYYRLREMLHGSQAGRRRAVAVRQALQVAVRRDQRQHPAGRRHPRGAC